MPIDPLDQQLVEAVLTRPRRGKADLEEAKLAGLRPSRAALDDVDEDEDEEEVDDEPELSAADDLDDDATVEVVGEDAEARTSRLPADGPTKLDAEENNQSRSRIGHEAVLDSSTGVEGSGERASSSRISCKRARKASLSAEPSKHRDLQLLYIIHLLLQLLWGSWPFTTAQYMY